MAVNLIHEYELELSFAGFIKKAAPFAVMQILAALVYVVLVLRFFG